MSTTELLSGLRAIALILSVNTIAIMIGLAVIINHMDDSHNELMRQFNLLATMIGDWMDDRSQ